MTQDGRDRVVVVLVRARNPANIGAAARAMHDFGFNRLRVVNEYAVPFQAAKSAVDASVVLEAAQEFVSVAEAVADCGLVLGTSAVGGRALAHKLYALEEAVGVMGEAAAQGTRVALLFGSEKTGLSNEELSYCHALVTIPMSIGAEGSERHLSMNLGQAVAVCLYAIGGLELMRVMPEAEEVASGDDTERVTGLLREVMDAGGYARRNPANAREASVRRLVRRMGLNASDSAVWTGILRQTLFSLRQSAATNGETDVETDASKKDAASGTPRSRARTVDC